MAESKSGTAEKPAAQQKTDTALKNERGNKSGGGGDDRYGGDEPLPYPEREPLDTVTYRDPRPLDWPQKADRSVFIGVVHKLDNDPDADDPKGDYVYANQLAEDDNGDGEIELSGAAVEHAQVIAGGGRLTLIIDGSAHDVSALGAGIQADLQKALQVNANS
jgi:hypothetical protein